MTDSAFITLVNMSLTAGYAILALLCLRPVFRRSPRRLLYGLWLLPLFRLVCPVSVESVLSLLPSARPIPLDLPYQAMPAIHSGIPALNAVVNPALAQSAPNPAASANPLQIWLFGAKAVWMIGLTALLCYAIVSYARLAYSLRYATREGEAWRSEAVATPMVLGFLRPRIYLPPQAAGEGYILAHEKAHISRGDHLVKPLAFLVLCLHWFNPLVWLAYALMVKDMEGACDERVLRTATPAQRGEYAACLLDMGSRRSGLAVPLAFGESDTAGRIKRILNYRKPAFWLLVGVALVAIFLCVTLLSNPPGTDQDTAIIGGADGPAYIILNEGDMFSINEDIGIKGPNLGVISYWQASDGKPTYTLGTDAEKALAELPVHPYMAISSPTQIEVLVRNPAIEEIRLSHTLLDKQGRPLYHKPDGSPLDEEGAFHAGVGESAFFGGKEVPLTRYTYTLEPSALLSLSSLAPAYPEGALRGFSLRYRIGEGWQECCFALRTDEGMYGPGEVRAELAPGEYSAVDAEGLITAFENGQDERNSFTYGDNLTVKGVGLSLFTLERRPDGTPTYTLGAENSGETLDAALARLPVYPYLLLSSLPQIEVLVQNPAVEELRISDTLLDKAGKPIYHKPGGALDVEEELARAGYLGDVARYTYTLRPSFQVLLSSASTPYPEGALRCFSLRFCIERQWYECCFVLRTDEGMYGPGTVEGKGSEVESAPANPNA